MLIFASVRAFCPSDKQSHVLKDVFLILATFYIVFTLLIIEKVAFCLFFVGCVTKNYEFVPERKVYTNH